jgi:hypothetical protein
MTHESGCDPTETLSSGFCPRKADAPLALTTSAISSAIAHRPRSDARSSSISCARIMTGRPATPVDAFIRQMLVNSTFRLPDDSYRLRRASEFGKCRPRHTMRAVGM